jgi:hypothetical protein
MDHTTPYEAESSPAVPARVVSRQPSKITTRHPWPSTGGLAHANTRLASFGDGSNEHLPPPRPVQVPLPPIVQPKRVRSVRFADLPPPSPFDGSWSVQEIESDGSTDESRSRLAHRFSECFENLNGALSLTNGNDTVLHRHGKRARPIMPHIDTSPVTVGNLSRSPSTASSSQASAQNNNASPVSNASTAATSFGSSPRSFSSAKRYALNDGHSLNQILPPSEEVPLSPIEEHAGRFFAIPQQDTTITAKPTIVTVEAAAAAKTFLEIHFHHLLLEPLSPRTLRQRRLEQDLADLRAAHEERITARRLWVASESDHLRQMRALKSSSIARHSVKGISIAGYDSVRVLGKGSFGVVRLVKERGQPQSRQSDDAVAGNLNPTDCTVDHSLPSGKPLTDVFAMKVIRKSEMLRGCQEGHLRAERDFLVNAEGSRWVVPLIASFQDNTNLYLVMEYMIGGDFLGLLLREDVLDEDVAK